jgi:hypothetical protein
MLQGILEQFTHMAARRFAAIREADGPIQFHSRH